MPARHAQGRQDHDGRRGHPRDLPPPPPGRPSTVQQTKTYFNNLFFNASRYDLSEVGRVKMNHKLHEEPRRGDGAHLTNDYDIVSTVKYLIELKNGRQGYVDIDHLGNRRVRAVGELMENQYPHRPRAHGALIKEDVGVAGSSRRSCRTTSSTRSRSPRW
ncbi:MAG: hypothetical protein U1F43_15215 [Myxococcota bacterium]